METLQCVTVAQRSFEGSLREFATMKEEWWHTKAKDMAPRPEKTVLGRMIEEPSTFQNPPAAATEDPTGAQIKTITTSTMSAAQEAVEVNASEDISLRRERGSITKRLGGVAAERERG
jgi:hypothetical protein